MKDRKKLIAIFWDEIIKSHVRRSRIERTGIRGHVEIFLENIINHEIRRVASHNIVTDAGDIYYAQTGIETPTYDFTAGGMKLGDSTTTPTKADTDVTNYLAGTYKTIYAGYPMTNDIFGALGGPDKRTWRYYWDTTEANGVNIREFAIVNKLLVPDAALCHGLIGTTIVKTSEECLTILVHHEFNGE